MSKDQSFGAGVNNPPFLYWELVHGGVSTPPNSYVVPSKFPLEAGATYYWRVRPRVQGDGTPTAWTDAYLFKTP